MPKQPTIEEMMGTEACRHCVGSGCEPGGGMSTCTACHGYRITQPRDRDEDGRLTCIVCGTEGYGIDFAHQCSPSVRCDHLTSEVRAVSTHSGMKVGARVSPSGALWWCVGCGGLFADAQGTHPVATPVWGPTRIIGR
jgi:DnaJ-class molecular chaperone